MSVQENEIDIVVLDDDEDLLASNAELLAELGYQVKGFSDPESAIEFAVDQKFKLGVFDFRLGSTKNGLDVVETLQMLGNKSTFIMVTADVEDSTRTRATALKVFEFLKKPVHPEVLMQSVERALRAATDQAA